MLIDTSGTIQAAGVAFYRVRVPGFGGATMDGYVPASEV